MPSFDPNSFSDGISTSEYAWLRADDHQPLINKATRGLYPPGSTLKPMAAIAAIEHGVDPSERHTCIGGDRLGNPFFRFGRESCRERVCQYVVIPVVDGRFKKQNKNRQQLERHKNQNNN